MFGLGIPEIIFIFLLAALILGPEHMPRVARTLGKWSAKARSAATALGEAVTQDEEVRAAAHDLSQIQSEIHRAKAHVLSIKDALHGSIADAARGVTGEDGAPENGEKAATEQKDAQLTETRVAPENGRACALEPAGPASSFFSRPLGEIPLRSDLETSFGGTRHADARRAVSLPAPCLLPESESRKVYRKKIAFSSINTHNIESDVRIAGLPAPDYDRAWCRVRRLSPPETEETSRRLPDCDKVCGGASAVAPQAREKAFGAREGASAPYFAEKGAPHGVCAQAKLST